MTRSRSIRFCATESGNRRSMGSPQEPTKTQYQLLEMAGKLAKFEEPRLVAVSGGEAAVGVTLHRQAVSLSVLEW